MLGPARVRLLPLGGGAGSANGVRARLLARGGLPLRLARLAHRPVEHAQVWFWRALHGHGVLAQAGTRPVGLRARVQRRYRRPCGCRNPSVLVMDTLVTEMRSPLQVLWCPNEHRD